MGVGDVDLGVANKMVASCPFHYFSALVACPNSKLAVFPQSSLYESFLFGAIITIGLIIVFRTGRVIKTMGSRFKIVAYVMVAVLIAVLIAVMLKQLQ